VASVGPAGCFTTLTCLNNLLFLAGIEAALKADPLWQNEWFAAPPERGLKAFARVYAGWLVSTTFFREEVYKKLGFPTLEKYLVGAAEAYWLQHDANNLLAQLWSWQKADISDNEIYHGNLAMALGAIKAKALIMPSQTDRYFMVEESALEMPHLAHGELRPIPSIMGHLAGSSFGTPEDAAFLAKESTTCSRLDLARPSVAICFSCVGEVAYSGKHRLNGISRATCSRASTRGSFRG
jgi:homoserine O-acetyltransferase